MQILSARFQSTGSAVIITSSNGGALNISRGKKQNLIIAPSFAGLCPSQEVADPIPFISVAWMSGKHNREKETGNPLSCKREQILQRGSLRGKIGD